MPNFAQYYLTDQKIIAEIEQGLRATYFVEYEAGFLETELGIQDLQANVFNRYNNSLRHVVPWVARHIDLSGKKVVEIGSGTGSSTAAFAHFVDSVHGYDIHGPSVEGARKRLEILGITNTRIDIIKGEELVGRLGADHQSGVDIMLLFAVLEHQTTEERIATIATCWQLLKPGGLLVVVETPNLLQYFDFHTSLLPFCHLLPTDMYARYAQFSPRNGFNNAFRNADSLAKEELDLAITRWGRGASYHDFELALGQTYGRQLVANGFEKEMLDWVGVCLEEEVLRYYIDRRGLAIPKAFSRVALNFILQKGDDVTPCDDSNVPGYMHLTSPEEILLRDAHIKDLELHLQSRVQHLENILNSKRWKLINALSSPYRSIKNLLTKP